MKNVFIYTCLALFTFSCADSETTKIVETEIAQDSIIMLDTIKAMEAPALFNMHPTLDFAVPEDADLKYADVLYYTGKIGDEEITMLLEEQNEHRWEGWYMYNTSGAIFNVRTDLLPKYDTVTFFRDKGNKVRETFKGAFSLEDNSYHGYWIKNLDTLTFDMKIRSNTDEESEIFRALSSQTFYNTHNGLVYDRRNGHLDIPRFSDYSSSSSWGDVYDFGEAWEIEKEMVFIEDNLIRYVKVSCNNETGTDFVEGKEPISGNDEDYEVAGYTYYSNNTISYKVIIDGVVQEKEIKFDAVKNATSWIMGDFIVFEMEKDEKEASLLKYKWNPQLLEYQVYI